MGRDSSVGIAMTWAVRESNPGGFEIFSTPLDRPWGPHSLLNNGHRVSFPGIKQPRRGVDYPPQFSAEVKERVALQLYSASGLHAFSRVKFTFIFKRV